MLTTPDCATDEEINTLFEIMESPKMSLYDFETAQKINDTVSDVMRGDASADEIAEVLRELVRGIGDLHAFAIGKSVTIVFNGMEHGEGA